MTGEVHASEPLDAQAFESFCAAALPDVYGFLVARCRDQALAEDLTADTFMAAVRAFRRTDAPEFTVGWLIVVARRRLVDHWRREERRARRGRLLVEPADDELDGWDGPLAVDQALAALETLAPHHRAALTLRYLDGLPVTEVARELGRGDHATEALLQRARRALRRAYEEEVQANA